MRINQATIVKHPGCRTFAEEFIRVENNRLKTQSWAVSPDQENFVKNADHVLIRVDSDEGDHCFVLGNLEAGLKAIGEVITALREFHRTPGSDHLWTKADEAWEKMRQFNR